MAYPAAVSKVLLIRGDGGTETRQWVGPAPVPVGRGPRNTLILADPTVSWQHAVIWAEGPSLKVRDLRSSNGTFVNEQRVESEHVVSDGDQLRFGSVTVTVVPVSEPEDTVHRSFSLLEIDTNVSHPLHRDRFRIGPDPGSDLVVEGNEAMLLVLIDEVRVVRGDEDAPLQVDEDFVVGGRVLRLQHQQSHRVPTISERPTGFPYRLEVALDGPLGPRALLTDLRSGARFQVDSGNRAVLLWLLARRFGEQDSSASEDRGWCADGEVQTALWGRSGDANKLDVLLHRLRSDLRKAGFDPWFIEKRNRHLRARVSEVHVLD